MSEREDRPAIMTIAAGAWCDPVTGVCHDEPADETTTTEPSRDDAAGDQPDPSDS